MFREFFKSLIQNFGEPPGTVPDAQVGSESYEDQSDVSQMNYDLVNCNQKQISSSEELIAAVKDCNESNITWINIDADNTLRWVKEIGTLLNLHPLTLEDLSNNHQRPKVEDWDDYLFVVLRMIYLSKDTQEIIQEQVGFILGKHYLITIQECPGDVFDLIRNRINMSKGRIRKMPVDYLMYSLIDTIVDNYFLVLDKFNERIEILEQRTEEDLDENYMRDVHALKQEILFFRRNVFPLKELINTLLKSESLLLSEVTEPYWKDLQDHTIQILESVEMLRDLAIGVVEISHATLSNRLNEVMKVLTMISTTFIPLTFIVGVYGMNFKYMPELNTTWGYPVVLAVMVVITIIFFIYFRKKKWW